MNFISVLIVAVALAMDATAVAIGVGTTMSKWRLRPVARLSFHFGVFQFFMPILGWLLGNSVSTVLQRYDHWIAFGLLSIVAAHMLLEALHGEQVLKYDPTRGWRMVMLAVATSIDAFAIGVTFVVLGIRVFLPCLIIGLVSIVLSFFGAILGYKTKRMLGKSAKILGAGILLLVATRILISHLVQKI